jgi:hypothetical protein
MTSANGSRLASRIKSGVAYLEATVSDFEIVKEARNVQLLFGSWLVCCRKQNLTASLHLGVDFVGIKKKLKRLQDGGLAAVIPADQEVDTPKVIDLEVAQSTEPSYGQPLEHGQKDITRELKTMLRWRFCR